MVSEDHFQKIGVMTAFIVAMLAIFGMVVLVSAGPTVPSTEIVAPVVRTAQATGSTVPSTVQVNLNGNAAYSCPLNQVCYQVCIGDTSNDLASSPADCQRQCMMC